MAQEFEGIAKVGITTSAYINRPEDAFAAVHALNEKGYELGLELYPFHTPSMVKKLGSIVGGGNGHLPIPGKVEPLALKDWRTIYPKAKVDQVHLPFAYDFPQAIYWATYIGKDSPLANAHHLAHMVCFGWATDGYIEKIVKALDNPDLVLNIHPEVAWKAARQGKFDRFTSLGKVAIEDTTEPPLTFKTWEKFNLKGLGFTLGLDHPDHLETRGLTVEGVLKDEGVRKYTTSIHLAGQGKSELGSDDMVVLKQIAQTPFAKPVVAYLDLDPKTLNGFGVRAQLDFWERQLDLIHSTQPQLAA